MGTICNVAKLIRDFIGKFVIAFNKNININPVINLINLNGM